MRSFFILNYGVLQPKLLVDSQTKKMLQKRKEKNQLDFKT